MTDNYNDMSILRQIVNIRFTFTDLDPVYFPSLSNQHGYWCPFHEHNFSEKHARIYEVPETGQYLFHCYPEGKNYTSFDYLYRIMIKSKRQYNSVREYLDKHMEYNEFISLYKEVEKNRRLQVETSFKKKCEWINNVFTETGNTIDYIEALYTA